MENASEQNKAPQMQFLCSLGNFSFLERQSGWEADPRVAETSPSSVTGLQNSAFVTDWKPLAFSFTTPFVLEAKYYSLGGEFNEFCPE
jgi:hypothetical protein